MAIVAGASSLPSESHFPSTTTTKPYFGSDSNLKPLDAQFKTNENKVEGCISQVWVRAYVDRERNVFYEADSDYVLTKGLAALLVHGFSGRPVNEVLRVSPRFRCASRLQQKLTLSRNNGFLNMLKLMQKKALLLHMEAEKGASEISSISISDSKDDSFVENSSDSPATKSPLPSSDVGLSSELDDKDIELGGRGKRVKEKLEKELDPVELQIEDVSYQHAGHAGVRGSNRETHFNLKVVSKEFEGKSLVKRLRLICNLLQEELPSGPHALSIVAKTPSVVNEG